MRTCPYLIAALLTAWIGSAYALPPSEPWLPEYNHYLPGTLNEFALNEWLRRDDRETALILLERAVRLDPYNPATKHNLETLRAVMKGSQSIHMEPPPKSPILPTAPKQPAPTGDESIPESVPELWDIPQSPPGS